MIAGNFEIRVATSAELEDVRIVRKLVFTDEQRIPSHLDHDGLDDTSIHAILCSQQNKATAGCGRLSINDFDKTAIISRIAVLPEFRGFSLGKTIVTFLEQEARSRNINRVELYPHKYLYEFYRSLGYQRLDDEEKIVADHVLIRMVKEFSR